MSFGSRVLFDEVSLRVAGKDRVSLVGSNGAGKSTLIKVIAGINQPDSGDINISKHTTVGYLPQEGIDYAGKTIYEEVLSAAGDINKIEEELKQIEKEMAEHPDPGNEDFMDLVNEYGELQERFQMLDGFKLKAKIEKILKGLGFADEDMQRLTDEFSGGWQMRIALGKLLLQNPSILLLDEPTNHLDIESLVWVEDYLKNYQGAIIMISHDRSFLDNITDRTVEISMGNVTEYSGNYSNYRKQKEIRKELLENQFNNQQKYLKDQNKFIERFRYKASKAKAVQSRIKLLDKIDVIEIEDEEGAVNFRFPPATHSGKITLEVEKLTKSYDGERNVLEDLNLIVERGEKIALVGVNGAGKSTFTRIIAGIEPYTGEVKEGHLVGKKFYAQNQAEELDPEKTVLETMESAATGDISKNLRTILGSFLFKGDDVFKKVKVLSGGEKSRLALAKMLIEPSNFLILDEPTNHLDMRSKEVLMYALKNYGGTVMVVSHDREFLDGIVDKVFEVKNKRIRTYYGNSTDYLDAKKKEASDSNADDRAKKLSKAEGRSDSKTAAPKLAPASNGLSQDKTDSQSSKKKELHKQISPLKKTILKIEEELTSNEIKLKELEIKMADPDFYKNGSFYVKKEYKEVKDRTELLNKKWETETDKLKEIELELNSK